MTHQELDSCDGFHVDRDAAILCVGKQVLKLEGQSTKNGLESVVGDYAGSKKKSKELVAK